MSDIDSNETFLSHQQRGQWSQTKRFNVFKRSSSHRSVEKSFNAWLLSAREIFALRAFVPGQKLPTADKCLALTSTFQFF